MKSYKIEDTEIHPVVSRIKSILDDNGTQYEQYEYDPVGVHPEYNLAQGTKALIVLAKKDGEKRFIMLALPCNKQFDKQKIKEETGYTTVRFATPEEVMQITDGVAPGGVPPFGGLFNLEVICDRNIFNNEKIIFNAGDSRIFIVMHSDKYKNLVHPTIVSIT